MTTLTVTKQGKVTFQKDVLKHLGIKPGDKVELNFLPNGKVELKAIKKKNSKNELSAMLKRKSKATASSISELNDVIKQSKGATGMVGLVVRRIGS